MTIPLTIQPTILLIFLTHFNTRFYVMLNDNTRYTLHTHTRNNYFTEIYLNYHHQLNLANLHMQLLEVNCDRITLSSD